MTRQSGCKLSTHP